MVKTPLAAKLADILSKSCTIPFRQAHRAVGLALKSTGGKIEHVTSDLLSSCVLKETGRATTVPRTVLSETLNINNLLGSFTYLGSPSPAFVKQATKKLLHSQAECIKKNNRSKTSWLHAKEQLIISVKKYLNKGGI